MRWLRGAVLLVAFVCGTTLALVLPWRWLDPPVTSFMLLDRAGLRGAPATAAHQLWLPLERISPELAIAVVAAEDQKFPDHAGFDFASIVDATLEDEARRGASTITQQVAKNLYLWPGRSLVRKGIEAWLTLWIEALWPKRRILEVYLNVAEFAPGVYGAGAAGSRLLGVPAADLDAWQAALLAAVLPSPHRLSPVAPSDYVRARAREIEAQVELLGGPAYLSRVSEDER